MRKSNQTSADIFNENVCGHKSL